MSSLLQLARDSFFYGDMSVDDVVFWYRKWLDQVFYVICSRFNYSKGKFEFGMFRGSKRGDDKYSFKICRKFERLYDIGRELTFFAFGSRGYVRSSCMHVVLEYDPHKVSLSEAWSRVGKDYNRFLSRIRKMHGLISAVRVWESHKSDYPHIHVLIAFHETTFAGYSSHKYGHVVYRTFGADWESFKRCWGHGYSNFELVDSFRGGIRYLSKYLVKGTNARFADSKGVRGLALCWIFRKRSFSISGRLFTKQARAGASARNDEIRYKSNSNLKSLSSEVLGNVLSSLGNSDVLLVKSGNDLFGNSIFDRIGRWHLYGFCIRESVLWSDWSMHLISGFELVITKVNAFDFRRSHYEVVR